MVCFAVVFWDVTQRRLCDIPEKQLRSRLQYLLIKIQKRLSLYILMLLSNQTLRLKDPVEFLYLFTFNESLPEDHKNYNEILFVDDLVLD